MAIYSNMISDSTISEEKVHGDLLKGFSYKQNLALFKIESYKNIKMSKHVVAQAYVLTSYVLAVYVVTVSMCLCLAVQTSCPSSQFRCARGSCVDKQKVCDFSDDCGDASDETNCRKTLSLLHNKC